jgi:two-component system nitrogen regulation response regulator GlnG
MSDSQRGKVLIIDDDAEIRYSLNRVLSARGYELAEAASGEEGIEAARGGAFEVVFLDNRMEGISGLETLQHLRSVAPEAMVILMTAFGTTQTAIEAMKFGAFDYIIKPFDLKKVLALTEKALQSHRDLQKSRGASAPLINSEDYQEGIVGSSEPMQAVFKAIGQVATSDVTVMITGESGTGKELVARCIHLHSLRSGKPFMAVNCAAIPDNLIESELFGHEKGAFTGATQQRLGKFELCDGGTLFLDEIGDMALPTQTKILRALQEGEIQRVGGEKTIRVDVRLIAATNRDLEQMVSDKAFREDLYYRLNVMRIRIPGLRDRLDDVPELVDFMLQRLNQSGRSRVRRVSAEALAILSRYRWPGNVRELENTIQRSAVMAQGDTILAKDLPVEILDATGGNGAEAADADPAVAPAAAESGSELSGESLWDALYRQLRSEQDKDLLQVAERELTRRVLRETDGNQVKASALLGITRATLRKRIELYGFTLS